MPKRILYTSQENEIQTKLRLLVATETVKYRLANTFNDIINVHVGVYLQAVQVLHVHLYHLEGL